MEARAASLAGGAPATLPLVRRPGPNARHGTLGSPRAARVLVFAAVAAVAAVTALAATGVLLSAPPAGASGAGGAGGASGASIRTASSSGPYYVAIGASEAVGVQPVPRHPHGVRTDQGYADDLTAMEQRRWPGLRLVDFGCPGITAQGALDGAGACRYPSGSEVGTAVRFIEGHPGEVVLVTVDFGFNDIWPCLTHHHVDERCVNTAIGRVARAVPEILAELRAAGDRRLLIVGLQHGDPYVADAYFGQVTFANATVAVFDRLNDVLSAAYARAGAVVAQVPDTGPKAAAPGSVQTACAQTWMCADRNIHPTPDGYRVIAGAIASAIARGRARAG